MKKVTQKENILIHLQQGLPLTQLQALSSYRCMRLAAVIHKLKRDGHKIEMRLKYIRKGVHVAEYFMPKK